MIAVTLPLVPVFTVLIGLQTRAQTERQWQLLARLGGHFLDVVEGLPTLKLFGRAQAQVAVIGEVTDAHRHATMRTLRVAFLSALVLELTAAVATALVAIEVGLRLLAGHMPYQTALLVLLLTPEAYLPLRAVGLQFHASMEGAPRPGRACEILETPASRSGPRTADRGAAGRGLGPAASGQADLRRDVIFLNGTSLVYPGRDRASAGPGVCWRSGPVSGSRSPGRAARARARCWPCCCGSPRRPGGGSRRPDGGPATDIAAFDLAAWRRQIAWVPQHPYLFDGTVASNIALGRPDAVPGGHRARGHPGRGGGFIGSLPGDYATPLGERGARLSAGQRQRIALARAFLQDAPLLLLDEPAAHLDPLTARVIIDTIERLMAGRTVLLITHGQGWLGGAERTITLDQGRLVLAAGCSGHGPAAGPAAARWRPRHDRPPGRPVRPRLLIRPGRAGPSRAAHPLLRLLRMARPLRGELMLAVLAGAASTGCAVALLATSGFLLARAAAASQHRGHLRGRGRGPRAVGGPGRVPLRRAPGLARRGLPGAGRRAGPRLSAAGAAGPGRAA